MTAYEVMLSESQERMIVVAKKEHEADVLAHFRRWEIHADVIGQVTDDGLVRIVDGDRPRSCACPPRCSRSRRSTAARASSPPASTSCRPTTSPSLPDIVDRTADANAALLQLLASPEIASKRWIYRQYDHQVLTNTVVGPGSDAAVLRIKRSVAARASPSPPTATASRPTSTPTPAAPSPSPRPLATSPAAAPGRSPSRTASTSATRSGLDVYYQLEEAIRGMAAACETLGVPVVSGNVSLLQRIERRRHLPDAGRRRPRRPGRRRRRPCRWASRAPAMPSTSSAPTMPCDGDARDLGGSEYLRQLHGLVAGRVSIDLALEAKRAGRPRRGGGRGRSCARRTTAPTAAWRSRWPRRVSRMASASRSERRRSSGRRTPRCSAKRPRARGLCQPVEHRLAFEALVQPNRRAVPAPRRRPAATGCASEIMPGRVAFGACRGV